MSELSNRRNRLAKIVASIGSVFMIMSLGIAPIYATPGDDAVEKAKADERRVARSVSQIEAELSRVSLKAQNDIREAQIADQNYMKAEEALDKVKEKADKLKEEADKARALVRKAKIEMSHISATVYRQGSSTVSSIEPYISADGLDDIYIRQVAVDIFGAKAEAKLQTVSALEEVASVISKREQKALGEQRKATRELKNHANLAKRTSENAINQVRASEKKREELIKELAEKRGVTLEAERQRQIQIDNERRERENAEALRRAERLAQQQARQQVRQQPRPSNNVAQPARPAPPVYVPPAPPAPNGNIASTAIGFARASIGIPYVWGGASSSGYDCSGLVLRAFQHAGVNLPRVAEAQYHATKRVPLNQIQPGDLLFWGQPGNIYHVAIYVGGGRMIEAPMPGMSVHETNVYYANITPYAGRV